MPPTKTTDYGDVRITKLRFDEALAKLGIDFPRYVILGACNPPLAQQALQQDINLGLLLPCNAVVYEDGGQVRVGAVDAVRMLSVANHPEMEGLARQVNEKLRRALNSVAPQPDT